ncbi:hypothetical protein P6709_20355, partial [Jeotgalibacillus sp. ET6]|uniref:hypothetical protein n=1 Tax=Jeotgalibacillus sp. ET6 TaxID=3037260 RepID=UPI0024189EB2
YFGSLLTGKMDEDFLQMRSMIEKAIATGETIQTERQPWAEEELFNILNKSIHHCRCFDQRRQQSEAKKSASMTSPESA